METLTYNTKKWPFREVVEKILGADLDHLNTTHYGLFDREHDQSSHWHKKFYAENEEFLSLYRKFVKEFIKPLFYEDIISQRIPTFRVHLRENVAVGEFHKDSDYGHSTEAINFWLPFTDTNEFNTIWIEDGETFTPQLLKYGEVLKFSGAKLRHGNKVNVSDTTRVSADFRVIPVSKYHDSEKSSINSRMKFSIGDYYEQI